MLYATNIIPFYLGHTKWQKVTADFILMAQKIMIIGDVWQPSGKNGRFLLSKHYRQHHIQAWPISRQKFCSWWFSNIQSWKKSFPRHHSFEKIMENIPWDYVFKMPTFFPLTVLISLKIWTFAEKLVRAISNWWRKCNFSSTAIWWIRQPSNR